MAKFSDHLRGMGFTPSLADMDMWMRRHQRPDDTEYYEYLVVYVDDVLIVSHNNRTRTLKGLLEAGLAFPFLVELSYTHA